MKTALLLVALILAGCAQKPQRTIYDGANDACIGFGFQPGTEAYGNCMQREVQSRRDLAIRMLYGR